MSAEQKDSDKNALAAKLDGTWQRFKQGKLISYKMMAVLLLVVSGVGLWWYISAGKSKQVSNEWRELDEANTLEGLEKIAGDANRKHTARLAELLVARAHLGSQGIQQLAAERPEAQQKAVENIEKAREAFGRLLDAFKDDPVLKAQCLLGLARAEAVLVGVPTTPGQLTEFRGKVPKLVEYLDRLADAAAPDTPWAADSKKLADALRDDKSAAHAEFISVQRTLTLYVPPPPPKSPFGGGFNPFGGGLSGLGPDFEQ